MAGVHLLLLWSSRWNSYCFKFGQHSQSGRGKIIYVASAPSRQQTQQFDPWRVLSSAGAHAPHALFSFPTECTENTISFFRLFFLERQQTQELLLWLGLGLAAGTVGLDRGTQPPRHLLLEARGRRAWPSSGTGTRARNARTLASLAAGTHRSESREPQPAALRRGHRPVPAPTTRKGRGRRRRPESPQVGRAARDVTGWGALGWGPGFTPSHTYGRTHRTAGQSSVREAAVKAWPGSRSCPRLPRVFSADDRVAKAPARWPMWESRARLRRLSKPEVF